MTGTTKDSKLIYKNGKLLVPAEHMAGMPTTALTFRIYATTVWEICILKKLCDI
jgi:hypothetical protein